MGRAERATLTPRQTEIAGLLAAGLRPQQIAERLDIALSTVHAHLSAAALRIGRPGPRMVVVACFYAVTVARETPSSN